ncbi:MAG: hypothetical protein KAI79_13250 [Bacteroidales bacterium]|nr:hypothetical protein [Bacteroidales bacterium]
MKEGLRREILRWIVLALRVIILACTISLIVLPIVFMFSEESGGSILLIKIIGGAIMAIILEKIIHKKFLEP